MRPLRSGNLIGLVGAAGAGKDTVCRALHAVGIKCQRFAFADPLKEEVADLLGITVAEIERNKPRYRGILQWWGTQWRRSVDDNYWIDRVAEAVDPFDASTVAVITDVRFPNEVEFVRQRGGKIVKVERSEGGRDIIAAAISHMSEQALRGYVPDLTISNPGTSLASLYPIVARVALQLNLPRREPRAPLSFVTPANYVEI